MEPAAFLSRVLDPGLGWVDAHAGVLPSRSAARPWLLAVALQETALRERVQRLAGGRPGPARGWWQFEAPTLGLLLQHKTSAQRLRALCQAAVVRPEVDDIWRALEGHDFLAVGVARLLLLTDPHPIPVTQDDGWDTYIRVWRPGKPHPAKWPGHWRAAQQAVGGR